MGGISLKNNILENEEKISRLGLSLLVILAGSFLAPLQMHSSTLAIPAIAAEMGLTADIISWFTLSQVLASACFVLPAGKLSDRFGRRRMFVFGLFICSIACFIGGVSFNGYMVLLARALQGVGAALIFAAAVALLVSVPPEDQKVRVMGIYISVAYVGMVTGPLFGGLVIEQLDWRYVFYVPGILFLVLTVIGFGFIKWERYGDRNTRIRMLDLSLYVGALLLIAFGVYDATRIDGQLLLVSGLVAFAAFCWFQSKRRDPLLQVKLFTESRTFTILGIAHFLTYVSILAIPFTLTLYLQYLKGLNAQSTGLILLVQALCTAIIAPFSGTLSKYFRPRHLIFTGVGVFVVACFMLASLAAESSIWVVVIAIGLMGSSVGIMDTPIVHTSMSTVDNSLLGSASATMNGLRTLGGFIGMGLVSYLMGLHLGSAVIEPSLYPQLMTVIEQFFIVAVFTALLTLVLLVYGVLTRPRHERH
ncbi:MAG: EmrB/QacA subfamily drug resistance transporter [Arenicella sp.]|jgi:EmrB/QacA subfamily drug resistance transporter